MSPAGRCVPGRGVRRRRATRVAAVADRAVRARDLVDGAGGARHPRQGRRHALLAALAVHRRPGGCPDHAEHGAVLPPRSADQDPSPQGPGPPDRPGRLPAGEDRLPPAHPDLVPPPRRRDRTACVAVIDGLLADNALFRLRAAQGVLGLADRHDPARLEAACAVATAAGDPSYRTIKGVLAAGTEARPATRPTGDGGAAAHLHGPQSLFAGPLTPPITPSIAPSIA